MNASLAGEFERLLPWIRSHFPQIETLRDGTRRIYLDNAAGTLVPSSVAEAMADAALWANPQPDRAWPSSPETKLAHRRVRSLLAGFLNAGEGDRIYLSESTTAALYKLREALEPGWEPAHNLVVTDCDHFANVSPWEWRARWQVRRAGMLPDGHLDADHYTSLLDERTRVAALAMAGNGLGTVIRLGEAVRAARERAPGAVVVVDAVHAAPHLPIDVAAIGADALVFSAYKLFGPCCGVTWLRKGLRDRLDPYHVAPHGDEESLMEWGTLNSAVVAGIGAALAYLQRLGKRLEPAMVGRLTGYPRENRLFKLALEGVRAYEASLSRQVLGSLQTSAVRIVGISDPDRAAERVPTFAFSLDGVPDQDLERRFWETGRLQVAVGTHYSAAVLRGLGRPLAARASFAHYNSEEEANAFTAAVHALQE